MKEKVNNRYFQIFCASNALGVISGAGEITQGGGAIAANGSQAFTAGAAGSLSQSASTTLGRFTQISGNLAGRDRRHISRFGLCDRKKRQSAAKQSIDHRSIIRSDSVSVLSTTRFPEAIGSAGPSAILTRSSTQEHNFAEFFAELPAEKAPNPPSCSSVLH
jgi:hypothetical protein